MNRAILISLLSLMVLDVPVAYSQQPAPILVLVARAPGVSSSAALSVLNELNQLTNQSGLSNYNFENAGNHVGAPNFVATSTCNSTNPITLINCAKLDNPDPNVNDLVYWRDIYDADIVVLVTPFINVAVCGVVPPTMINNPNIAQGNHPLGWAAVGLTCNIPGTFYPAAHEVLHLLSIEHKLGDPSNLLSTPERDNHGHTSGIYATAGAAPADCTPNQCTTAVNKMSSPSDTFPNSFQMGSTLHSDAKNVVKDHSWNAVVGYRPLPIPSACVINVSQVCENNSPRAIVTPTLAGYTMTNIDLDYQLSGSSNWYPIYDGAPTCPIYNQPSNFMNSVVSALVTTAAGYVSGCTVQVTPIWCGSGDPL